MNLLELALMGFAFAFGFAVLGAWVAIQKDRSPFEGGTLGFLFGPFGVLIEALLPTSFHAVEREREHERHLDTISDPDIVPMRPEEAWLKELENRHRSAKKG